MLNLFSKVLDMSLTASVVIGIVLILRMFLRNAPKIWSYVLWSAVLFRLLCPVGIASGVTLIPSGVGYKSDANTLQVVEVAQPGQETVEYVCGGDVDTVPVYAKPESDIGTGKVVDLMHPEVWVMAFSRLWPTGVVLMAAYSLYSLMFLCRRLRGATHLRENIYRVDGLETAFVMGLLHPNVYLPAGLSEREEAYIICHERYHIRRGDHIVKLLAFAALCVHWFNPLVWLAFVLAGKDMEMSCDEAVMKSVGEDIRADYSRSLLCLATGRRGIAAMPLAFGEGDTKGRIKNVLKWKKPGMKITILALIVCAAVVALCISDPAQPVDPEQVARVYSQHLSLPEGALMINEDEVSVTEKLIFEEGREELFDLLNRYTATRMASLPTWKPRATYGEHAARLEMKDGGCFELRSWYVNGFSFHPAHFREDEYDTTLAEYDSAGNLIACWKMEYDFDQPFRDWLMEQARNGKTPVEMGGAAYPARRGMSFENLEPGQTVYLNEDVVLAGQGSQVSWQVTYARAGLTLQVGLRAHANGTEYVAAVEGGSGTGVFEYVDPGVYTPFVRNVDKGYDFEPDASGAVNFDLRLEEDYFQNGTPWPETEEPLKIPEDAQIIGPLPGNISLTQELHHAVLEHHRSDKSDENFCCASIVVLDNYLGTRSHPITGEDDLAVMDYFLWVLYQEYQFTEDGIVDMGGSHLPVSIRMEESGDGSWSVRNYWVPRDGSYYVEDIRMCFPEGIVEEALDSQKYILRQKQDCYAQAVAWAKVSANAELDVDAVISGLLDVLCSNPLESSDVQSYRDVHPIAYRELLYYGQYTRDYCDRHLQAYYEENAYGKGTNDAPEGSDLRERIMEQLLADLNP